MKRKMYATELMKKLVSAEELVILEISANDELSIDEKINLLLRKDNTCSNLE
jgi:hypothetical protein